MYEKGKNKREPKNQFSPPSSSPLITSFHILDMMMRALCYMIDLLRRNGSSSTVVRSLCQSHSLEKDVAPS